jgi:3-oxoacyl-[acyl-carrier-protein] synthase II
MPRFVEDRAHTDARRVVVTGTGLITPLGTGVEKNWTALMAGRSGIGPITRFECADFPTRICGEVRDFVPEDWIERREIKKMDPFIQYAVAAAQMAMDQSGLKIPPADADRVGVIVGVGMGGILSIEQFHTLYLESRLRRVSPFFVAKVIANLAPGQISIRFGARGVNYTPTSACASGANAVGEAFRNIRDGYQDAVIAGGTEAALCGLGIGGFIAMRALSSRNDEPERASRPFDRQRDGFVISEGAGILVLESLAHAKARGAHILGEMVGYGANADAFHITAPAPGGEGAARCMQQALRDGGIAPTDVGYINAHGTSTEYNDASESEAIRKVFGEHATITPPLNKAIIATRRRRRVEGVYTVPRRARSPADHQLRGARPRLRSRLRAQRRARDRRDRRPLELLRLRRRQRVPRVHHYGSVGTAASDSDAHAARSPARPDASARARCRR